MGHFAGSLAIYFSFLLAFLWTLVLSIPTGWHQKGTTVWHFTISLFHVDVHETGIGQGINWLAGKFSEKMGMEEEGSNSLRKTFSHSNGSIQSFRDNICIAENSGISSLTRSCQIWDNLYIGSIVLAICGGLCVLTLLTGAAFSYYYWNQEAAKAARKTSLVLFWTAPLLGGFGLVAYAFLTYELGDWLSHIRQHSGVTFSWNFIFGLIISVFSFLPIFISMRFAGMSEKEKQEELLLNGSAATGADLYNAESGAAGNYGFYGSTGAPNTAAMHGGAIPMPPQPHALGAGGQGQPQHYVVNPQIYHGPGN